MTTDTELMRTLSDFDYDVEFADAAAHDYQQRVSNISASATPLFRNVNASQIQMVWPVFRMLEHDLGVTIYVANPDEYETTPPEFYTQQLRELTNDDGTPRFDDRTVVFARHGFLYGGADTMRHLDAPGSFPALADRVVESPAEDLLDVPTWSLSHGTLGGYVGPHVITGCWWWRTTDSTPEQLLALYNGLRGGVESALNAASSDEYGDAVRTANAVRISSLISARGTQERRRLESHVREYVASAADYERRAREATARLDEMRAQLRAIADTEIPEAEVQAIVERELRALDDHPDIVSVTPTTDDSAVRVVTRELPLVNIRDRSQQTLGGAYAIQIRFGTAPEVTVRNLTRRLGSYDHPHVSEGQFCLGDQRSLVNGLATRMELAGAVSVVVDLLKQVNPADVYTQEWQAWFEMEDDA